MQLKNRYLLLPLLFLVFGYMFFSVYNDVRIGKEGYAWVISEKGVELYCPVPGHTGKTAFRTSEKFPSVIAMAGEMMKGRQGSTTYTYDRIKATSTEPVKKLAVYFPRKAREAIVEGRV